MDAVVRDSAGVTLPTGARLVSADTAALAVDTSSRPPATFLTPRRLGPATVSLTVAGRTLTASLAVTEPRVAAVGFAFFEVVVPVGAERPLDVGVFVAGAGGFPPGPDGGRIDWPVTWRSDAPGIASVDARGVVTGVSEGTTFVKATSAGVIGAVAVRAVRLAERPVFTAIAAGRRQTCALSTGGIAYCWGSDARDALGLAVVPEKMSAGGNFLPVATLPLPVASPVRFTALAAGTSSLGGCALTADGAAYCWSSAAGAVAVPGSVRFASLSASIDHVCGVAVDGRGYCWGSGGRGQLGLGTPVPFGTRRDTPTEVAGDLRFTTISAGVNEEVSPYSCGVTVDGALWCWGDGTLLAPTRTAAGVRFRTVTVGGQTCAIAVTDATYCWNGPTAPNDLASARADDGHVFVAAAGAPRQACGLERGGAVYCWPVTFAGRGTPALVPGAPPLAALAVAAEFEGHGCGLTAAGTAHCWGDYNLFGELGAPRVDTFARWIDGPSFFHFTARYRTAVRVMGQP